MIGYANGNQIPIFEKMIPDVNAVGDDFEGGNFHVVAVDGEETTGHQHHYPYCTHYEAFGGLVAYVAADVHIPDWVVENYYCIQDGENAVGVAAVAGILDVVAAAAVAAAVANEVVAVVEEGEVEGHDFHDPGRDFVHGTVSQELVHENPMIQFQLDASDYLAQFFAQARVRRN